MFIQKISLDQALALEESGTIILVDNSQDTYIDYHPRAFEWKSNFTDLRLKAPHISSQKLFDHYTTPYLIEVTLGEYHWRYLQGVLNLSKTTIPSDNIEYVYILTNEGYPGLLKIGMTAQSPEVRLKSINGTGTVRVWKLAFALPLRSGSAYKVETQVHKYLNHVRYHAEKAFDREMFNTDLTTAVDIVRRLGEVFRVGDPIFYS
jgi:hypothetical protein